MAEPFFDYQAAIERLDDDEEFLVELLNELVIQIDESWPSFKEAVDSADFDSMRAKAHSIKGAAANLNVEKVAEIFYGLEQLGHNKSMEGVDDLLQQARHYNELLRDFLKTVKL